MAKLQWEAVSFKDENGTVVFIEIIPSEGHISSEDCWCGPEIFHFCDECEAGESCWKCRGERVVEYDSSSPEAPVAMHYDDRIP